MKKIAGRIVSLRKFAFDQGNGMLRNGYTAMLQTSELNFGDNPLDHVETITWFDSDVQAIEGFDLDVGHHMSKYELGQWVEFDVASAVVTERGTRYEFAGSRSVPEGTFKTM